MTNASISDTRRLLATRSRAIAPILDAFGEVVFGIGELLEVGWFNGDEVSVRRVGSQEPYRQVSADSVEIC